MGWLDRFILYNHKGLRNRIGIRVPSETFNELRNTISGSSGVD